VNSHIVRSFSRWTIGAVWCTGCSLAVNADRVQCSTDEDCANRGFPASVVCNKTSSVCEEKQQTLKGLTADSGADAAPKAKDPLWGCEDEPRVTTTATGPFHVTFHLAGILDPAPIADATAQVCKKIDVECTVPVATAQSDMMGNVSFDIDKNFSGYVQFQKGTDIVPGLYFFNPPPDHDLDMVSVQIVTPGIVTALTKTLMSPQLMQNGLTLINTLDCNGKGAAGISIVGEGLDKVEGDGGPPPTTFYSIGGLPNAGATETDSGGFGGFVNLPPGTLAVKGIVNGTKRELQEISILIRANAITYAKLVPLGR
jgi:hypothetical protein